MSFSVGLVGLPNVGKSTIFNALTRAQAAVSNYPFCTIDKNLGVVNLSDERLFRIAQIIGSAKTIPNTIEFVDIAGLVQNAHEGEGLGNQFLSHIREVDAIGHVLRAFDAQEIVHVDGRVDFKKDAETVNLELLLADLKTIEKREESLKNAAKSGDKKILKELSLIEKIKDFLQQGIPVRDVSLVPEEKALVETLSLLTAKPIFYILNVNEEELTHSLPDIDGKKVVAVSAKLEMEASELSPAESLSYFQELGFSERGVDLIIKAGFEVLDLIVFFTANENEARAFSLKKGTLAQKAAGKVHSDMEKGFIRAEVVSFSDLDLAGNYQKVREKGALRLEGREYEVKDGDLLFFRFNL